jgi:allantoinase
MSDVRNVITDGAPARPGYDHGWFPWNPPPARPRITWPGGARTAVSVVLHLGAAEWEDAQTRAPRPPAGRGIAAPPDVPRMSHREFGHRVGVFRLLQILDGFAVAPAAVVDVLTAEHYRPLLHHLLPVAAEVLAGGLSAGRPITSVMGEDEERDYIGTSLERLAAAVGTRPAGWLGPEHSESARTPALLAQAGLRYVADWANDDLPYPMPGAGPDFWAFPLSWELSDLSAAHLRLVSPTTWETSVTDAFDVLHADGGRILALHLQPWLSGQAFRAAAVEAALRHVREAGDVWFATPVEIVEHCRGQVTA